MSSKGLKYLCGSIIFLTACIIAIATFLHSAFFMSYSAKQLEHILESSLANKITLERLELASFRSIRAEGVEVLDAKGNALGRAELVEVKLSPWKLISAEALGSIDRVSVSKGNVFLAKEEGKPWNYEELFSTESNGEGFEGKVELEDISLQVSYEGYTTNFDNINMLVDISKNNDISLLGKALWQGGELEGSWQRKGESDFFDLSLIGGNVADYSSLGEFFLKEPLPVEALKGDLKYLKLSGTRDKNSLSYQGEAHLEEGGCTYLNNQLDRVQALLLFNDKELKLFSGGELNGQRLSLHGDIFLEGERPALNLQLSSNSLYPEKIFSKGLVKGEMAFSAHIQGDMAMPVISGWASLQNGELYNVEIQSAKGEFSYRDEMLMGKNLEIRAFGGSLQGTGEVDLSNSKFVSNLKLKGINIAELAPFFAIHEPIGGELFGDVNVAGSLDTPDMAEAWGTVKVTHGNYGNVNIPKLYVSFNRNQGNLTIDKGDIHFANGGVAGFQGKLDKENELSCDFYGMDIDMSLLQELVPNKAISGTLNFKGNLEGNISQPIIKIEYLAKNGEIYGQPFDRFYGSAGGSLRGVKINEMTMEHGENTKWYVAGVVGFLGEQKINLRIDTVAARMENLIKPFFPERKITGNVDNVIQITGSLKKPEVVGYIHCYQGSYNDMLISGMDGDYTFKNGILMLQDFHVYTPWLDVDLNGSIDLEENIDLRAQVHEIELERYNNTLPVPLDGKGKFQGILKGTISAPIFKGDFTADELKVNGEAITDINGSISYQNHRLYVDDISFARDKGKYLCYGMLNLKTAEIKGQLSVENADLHSLLVMGGINKNGIEGNIFGTAVISGRISSPQIQANVFLPEGSLGSYPMRDVIFKGRLANKRIMIQELSGKEGEIGNFSAQGYYEIDGNTDIAIAVRSFDIGAISEAAGINIPVKGLFNTDIAISGKSASPRVVCPINIANCNINGARADSVKGSILLEDGIIDIKDLSLNRELGENNYKVKVNGSIPLLALEKEVATSEAEQMNIVVALDEADISLLPLPREYVDWALGKTAGRIYLKGTMATPHITGSMELEDGAMKLQHIAKPVTNMNMRLFFMDDTMTVEKFSGQLGRGEYNGAGFVHLNGMNPDKYNLSLTFNELEIESQFYKGPLQGRIAIEDRRLVDAYTEEEKIIPHLQGRLFLENVMLSFPDFTEEDSQLPLISLDYDLELGKNVRFISNQLADLALEGSAHFGGTTEDPHTVGRINVIKGTLDYLKTSFKVTQGELLFGQPLTLMPKVLIQANTKINDTMIFLSLNGLPSEMEFKLFSFPPMSELELIQFLTLRSQYDRQKNALQNITSMVNIGLQMAILAEVEAKMRNALNLDLFKVERETREDIIEKTDDNYIHEVYNVTVGKNLNENVLLKLTKTISNEDYNYGFEYEFARGLNLTGIIDQDNDLTVGIEARFSF